MSEIALGQYGDRLPFYRYEKDFEQVLRTTWHFSSLLVRYFGIADSLVHRFEIVSKAASKCRIP
jgi:hypothetical protein